MEFDYVVIGGGIFGVYTALHLAEQMNYKVCLIEKESQLMRKATIVNQARLHCGYHYPRSIATAKMSDENRVKFAADHKRFINNSFKQYYAISKQSSFTSAKRFEAFCSHLNIKCSPVFFPSFINPTNIESVYLTEEVSFDPIQISNFYQQKIDSSKNITILYEHLIYSTDKTNDQWVLCLKDADKQKITLSTYNVVNATYFNTNHINILFDQEPLELVHELTEMAFFSSTILKNVGLTIMDGPFIGFMPYGNAGINSLYSVLYSVHHKSQDQPSFPCQITNSKCSPINTSICNRCPDQPTSNYKKMASQLFRFINNYNSFFYLHSMYTIRTKLKASSIDDGRPTSIVHTNSKPGYSLLLAGKINSIYEIDKFFK